MNGVEEVTTTEIWRKVLCESRKIISFIPIYILIWKPDLWCQKGSWQPLANTRLTVTSCSFWHVQLEKQKGNRDTRKTRGPWKRNETQGKKTTWIVTAATRSPTSAASSLECSQLKGLRPTTPASWCCVSPSLAMQAAIALQSIRRWALKTRCAGRTVVK